MNIHCESNIVKNKTKSKTSHDVITNDLKA